MNNTQLKKKRFVRQGSTMMTNEQAKQHQWIQIDASGLTLGRLASQIARVLRGKHRPSFTPHVDCGDGVIVINVEKVMVTGQKEARKLYRHYTGHIGGLREYSFEELMAKDPKQILERAVKGMMPRTRLGRKQLTRLRLFVGSEHNHEAQTPIKAEL